MKSFDAFGKPVQQYQVKTSFGGYLSIASFILIVYLFIAEFQHWLTPEVRDEMTIDQNQDRKYVNISLDITFYEVPCSVIYMNLMDSKKANVMHVIHEIYKTRLTKKGRWIGKRIRDSLRNVAQTSAELQEAGSRNATVRSPHATTHLRCGSCFQSHVDEDDCCPTCQDVKDSFKSRGWDAPKDYVVEQCENEAYEADKPQEGEGCRIDAKFQVRKVAATIHIGVGRYFAAQHLSKNANRKEYITHLNFHHEIHKLSFGPDFPGLIHVLDGRRKNQHQPPLTEHFQYDIHVIPTVYRDENIGEEIQSHQYSVTEYVKNIDESARRQELVACGFWANYDFTPFEVKVTNSRKPFSHFLTECCAILGGIFAFTGMLDKFTYGVSKAVAKRGHGSSVQMTSMMNQAKD